MPSCKLELSTFRVQLYLNIIIPQGEGLERHADPLLRRMIFQGQGRS